MANVNCHACDRKIPERSKTCPYCRAVQEVSSPASSEYVGGLAPGWYERRGHANTLTYWDGYEFTDKVAPAKVQLELATLVRGVALGVVAGTFITGFVFFLLTR